MLERPAPRIADNRGRGPNLPIGASVVGIVAPAPAVGAPSPVVKTVGEPLATHDGAGQIDKSLVTTYRLLLVSDHRAASEALLAHLTRHGFAIVAHESTPDRAAQAARIARPDVVLIDAAIAGSWQPVVEALEGLIARDHVAVLAAYWSAEGRRAAAGAGIGATLLKRVGGSELVDRLRSLAAAA